MIITIGLLLVEAGRSFVGNTNYLVDEFGNNLVDEFGNKLIGN